MRGQAEPCNSIARQVERFAEVFEDGRMAADWRSLFAEADHCLQQ